MKQLRIRLGVSAVLALTACVPLGAQTPTVRVTKSTPVRTLSTWPGLTLAADQDAHTVVVAVTRGPKQTAVQVLSPVEPTRQSFVRKGARLPVRSLKADEIAHLMSYNSRPLILAFASKTKPNFEAFAQQNRWASEVVLDTATASVQEVIGVLGRELFGDVAAVSTLAAEAASPRLLSAQAKAFSFVESCERGATQYWNGAAGDDPFPIMSYPDWNWGQGKLISGQTFKIIPAQSVGSACIEARMALYPSPTPGMPARPVPTTSPAGSEAKMNAIPDKPVEAIPKHMAPGPVVYPPSPKPPR